MSEERGPSPIGVPPPPVAVVGVTIDAPMLGRLARGQVVQADTYRPDIAVDLTMAPGRLREIVRGCLAIRGDGREPEALVPRILAAYAAAYPGPIGVDRGEVDRGPGDWAAMIEGQIDTCYRIVEIAGQVLEAARDTAAESVELLWPAPLVRDTLLRMAATCLRGVQALDAQEAARADAGLSGARPPAMPTIPPAAPVPWERAE